MRQVQNQNSKKAMPSNTLTFHPKVNCYVDKWQVSWLSQLLLPSRADAPVSTMVFVTKVHSDISK
jgi:hypothetical protein